MKISVLGYYGFGNIGDEIILTVLLRQLKIKYPTASVSVLSAAPSQTASLHHISTVNRWNFFSVMKSVWSADLFIFGGGGLIQDATSLRSFIYYLFVLYAARLFGATIVLYAVGVEKLESQWGKRALKNLLNQPTVVITVRDQESKALLTEAGVSAEKINVTADPVFSNGVIPSSYARYSSKGGAVLFIPRYPCPTTGESLYVNLLGKLKVDPLLKVQGMLFHRTLEQSRFNQGELRKVLPPEAFISEPSVEKVFDRFAHFDFVVSARFHGLVLAALAGRPFLGIGDPEKVGRFCRAWGQPFLPWNASPSAIKEGVDRLLVSGSNPAQHNIEEWRQAAERTIQFV